MLLPRPQRMILVRLLPALGLWWMTALAPAGAQAQGVRVPVDDPALVRDTLVVDTAARLALRPFILPGTEQIYLDGVRLDTTQYRLDHRHGQLLLRGVEAGPGAQLVAVYRTLPFAFRDVYRRRSVGEASAPDSLGTIAVVEEAASPAVRFDPFGETRLQRSGSITRGILAGNNRDVTVESGLRMQLSGEIVDGVNVQAVLTDENTPILPEGTTQRLEEFDRVFIQLDAPVGTAQLGDFDLHFAGTEFARFNRKLQGVSVFSDVPGGGATPFGGGRVAVAGATSRGTYRTQEIEPLDGVQGPYRLEGTTGERFIIVVPGSEIVYLDGQRMVRGETNDYVIDYATAEITFTANRMITADRRISVEFQYSTNQFTRTLVGTQAEARFWPRGDGAPRARLGTTFLREADGRQFSTEFGLSAADSLLLVSEGDGVVRSDGAERVTFDPEAPFTQYVRELRPLPDGTADTAYVALTARPPDTVAVYRVRFSRVGPGQGRYRREGQQMNGIVYVYHGPGLGEYEPVRILPKPRQQRLFDLHGGVRPLPGLEVFGEWAHSLFDENRLSPVGDADDVGHAYLTGLRLEPLALALGPFDEARLSAEVRRRYVGANFASFDRIRPVEFGRRWNLPAQPFTPVGEDVDRGDEVIDEAHLQLDVTPATRLRLEGGRIDLGGAFEGARQEAVLATAEPGLPHLAYRVEHVTSRDTTVGEDGTWLRQLARLEQPFLNGRLVPHLEVEHEDRRQRVLGTDSLARRSFAFVEYRPGVAWTAGTLDVGGEVEWRVEDDWSGGVLRDAARAWTVQTNLRYRPGATFSTDADIGYRIRRFTDHFRIEEKREDSESVVMRWNSRYQPLKRAVDVSWLYEALTERTPRLQEIYIRTGPELGQFVWEDANGNGIVEIEEMIPERTPNEGTYAQTFIPSDTLISVINLQARLRVELEPSRLWPRPETRWQHWLTHVTTRTTVDIQEKSREPELEQIYLLNLRRFRDPVHTLSGRLRIGQDVFLFRSEPRYGVDLSFNQLRGLNQLAAGQEGRFLNTWRAEGRYRPATTWGVKLVGAMEQNRVSSESFASRRYDIESLRLEPEVSFNPSRALQLLGGVNVAQKRDAEEDRTARLLKVPLEARYTLARRLQVASRFEVAHVRLTGDAAGLARYELTDGRGPGTSFLWNLSGNYTLNEYLRASFSYDGRAPSDAPVIHTVRLQLSALF